MHDNLFVLHDLTLPSVRFTTFAQILTVTTVKNTGFAVGPEHHFVTGVVWVGQCTTVFVCTFFVHPWVLVPLIISVLHIAHFDAIVEHGLVTDETWFDTFGAQVVVLEWNRARCFCS